MAHIHGVSNGPPGGLPFFDRWGEELELAEADRKARVEMQEEIGRQAAAKEKLQDFEDEVKFPEEGMAIVGRKVGVALVRPENPFGPNWDNEAHTLGVHILTLCETQGILKGLRGLNFRAGTVVDMLFELSGHEMRARGVTKEHCRLHLMIQTLRFLLPVIAEMPNSPRKREYMRLITSELKGLRDVGHVLAEGLPFAIRENAEEALRLSCELVDDDGGPEEVEREEDSVQLIVRGMLRSQMKDDDICKILAVYGRFVYERKGGWQAITILQSIVQAYALQSHMNFLPQMQIEARILKVTLALLRIGRVDADEFVECARGHTEQLLSETRSAWEHFLDQGEDPEVVMRIKRQFDETTAVIQTVQKYF